MLDYLIELERNRTRSADKSDRIVLPDTDAVTKRKRVFVSLNIFLSQKLFDKEWYLNTYQDIREASIDAAAHYFEHGAFEGRRPNPYFDPAWYLAHNPELAQEKFEPLTHYVLLGEKHGQRPSPVFDPVWYRKTYEVPPEQTALGHYLLNRTSGAFSPIEEFDAQYYCGTYPDIAQAQVDPFEHYINHGYREGRNPSKDFDTGFYRERYLGGSFEECPLFHYMAHKGEPGIFGRMASDEPTIPREIKKFTRRNAAFEDLAPMPAAAEPRAKLLAYYLPQFHAFAENDEWWGNGFTEWTNLARGIPRFVDHYQPRIPRDLGFYSLDHLDVMRRQVDMAKAAGVHGFVFYHYWFNGRRLMEAPIDRFLGDTSVDMPFCLMWANENWTRRWDGAESEVLISQDYSEADDAALIADFARHFRDSRYIRVAGRPLLMIYRPGIVPNARETIERWRRLFESEHGEQPIILMAQGFNDTDPRPYGLDGAIEFPPHKLTADMPPINADLKLLDFDYAGKAYAYEEVVSASLAEPKPPFPLIKTIVPSWDNDARRQGTGLTMVGSTPAKYEAWLSELAGRASREPVFGEAFVCVNAWNEWCEGAYLEPDLHFGAAYLNATWRALTGLSKRTNTRLVLVGHDAFPSGAQQLLLNIGRTLKRRHGVEIEFLLLDGGRLVADYAATAPTTVANGEAGAVRHLERLGEQGFASALVNTSAAARILPAARSLGFEAVLLVHELPRLLKEKGLEADLRAGAEAASAVVFAAPFVRDRIQALDGMTLAGKAHIVPNGLYKNVRFEPVAAARIRERLGVGPNDRLVVGAGYADLRKGFDLFLSMWRGMNPAPATGRGKKKPAVHFCWVGDIDPQLRDWLAAEIAAATARGSFHLTGYQPEIEPYFSAADAFALTSREDPYPAVVHEALSAGAPVVAFDGTGGIPDLLRETGAGLVVPYADGRAMEAALGKLLKTRPGEAERAERQARAHAAFAFAPYVQTLLGLALPDLRKVSVAVPNYNYARYMPERLGSIFRQAYPVHEVIVLDDCSTDDSLPAIERVAADWGRDIRLVANERNSGSVFAQWRKAAELATGEFLWIAEADDSTDPQFLARLMALMAHDPAMDLAFSDSRTINGDGTPQWENYKAYYATVEQGALSETRAFEAGDFVRRYLAVKNLILNVSAVVWRREALLRALAACESALRDFKMAGDWRLYLELLSKPSARIGYEAEPLNVHRRHAESVTHALRADAHLAEIAALHEQARRFHKLSMRIVGAQEIYMTEVTKQLKEKNPPSPSNQPEALKKRIIKIKTQKTTKNLPSA